jgi:hypothetical protein
MGLHWRPSITAHAHADHPAEHEHDAEHIAPRDAGWAELWSIDGAHRIGRGHLMVWALDAAHAGKAGGVVGEDAAQAMGSSVADLRAELRSFTPEGEMPAAGDAVVVVPEHDGERYPVTIEEVIEGGEHGKAMLELDWPDDRLPAALAELGGH